MTTATVSYDPSKSALLVELPQKENYDNLLGTTRGLADKLQDHGCAKLYVDARQIELELSINQIFHLMAAVIDSVPRGVRVAVAVRPMQRLLVEFASVVARHRGIILEVFDSPAEALGWLTWKARPAASDVS